MHCVCIIVGAVSAKQHIHPLGVWTVFSRKSPDSGQRVAILYLGRTTLESVVVLSQTLASANHVLYMTMIYFHFGA